MTKLSAITSGFLLILCIVVFILGFSTGQTALVGVNLFCGLPLLLLTVGFAVGRASNEFEIVSRDRPARGTIVTGNNRRRKEHEVLG